MTLTGQKCAHNHIRSSLALLGGALQVRTGMLAQPSWCKSQIKEETKQTKRTSENNNLRRYFFDTYLEQPGYLAGFNYVQQPQPSQPSQPSQPNHHMIGFFDDSNNMNPASAGFICVLTNYNHKNPAKSRVFYCTKEKQLSGDHHA